MAGSGTLRTRFSPAPTGFLHVGNARSALFGWLVAKQAGGEMLLRVEDTNAELYKPEYVESMLGALAWLHIDFDGEPLYQSTRADLYRSATGSLIAAGAAYRCECTTEEVKARTANNPVPGYDGRCRDRDLPDRSDTAVRFRVPDEGDLVFDDVVHGKVTIPLGPLEDFVIQRSNGSATFYLPNALDDVDMAITHVIRGDDLLNTVPRVLLIREALGNNDRPVYAHLPMIVNDRRKKLSKRRDDVAIESYITRGYLGNAMANYLAVLGWGPPDGVEIRPMEEIVDLFRLDDVVKSSAFFDLKKLDHFDATYIRAMPAPEFAEKAAAWLGRPVPVALLGEVQTRVVKMEDVPDQLGFLFVDEVEAVGPEWQKGVAKLGPVAAAILDDAVAEYSHCDWEADVLHELTASITERHGLALAKGQAPIRVAVTGRTVGPPLFQSLVALGRDRTLDRIRKARARLDG